MWNLFCQKNQPMIFYLLRWLYSTACADLLFLVYRVLGIYIFGWDMDSVRKKKTLEYIYPNIPWMVVKIEHPRKPKSILRLESPANNRTVESECQYCSKTLLNLAVRHTGQFFFFHSMVVSSNSAGTKNK